MHLQNTCTAAPRLVLQQLVHQGTGHWESPQKSACHCEDGEKGGWTQRVLAGHTTRTVELLTKAENTEGREVSVGR